MGPNNLKSKITILNADHVYFLYNDVFEAIFSSIILTFQKLSKWIFSNYEMKGTCLIFFQSHGLKSLFLTLCFNFDLEHSKPIKIILRSSGGYNFLCQKCVETRKRPCKA